MKSPTDVMPGSKKVIGTGQPVITKGKAEEAAQIRCDVKPAPRRKGKLRLAMNSSQMEGS